MYVHHLASFVWSAMWPNIFAPSFWTLFGIAVAHIAGRRALHEHTKKQTEELKAHIEDQLGSQTDELKEHVSAEVQNNAG
jgi:superoxide dismutase